MQTRMMLVAALCASAARGISAAVFPLPGGDIALPSNWGGETLPASCELNQTGIYTASSDVSFNSLVFSCSNYAIEKANMKLADKRARLYVEGNKVRLAVRAVKGKLIITK